MLKLEIQNTNAKMSKYKMLKWVNTNAGKSKSNYENQKIKLYKKR